MGCVSWRASTWRRRRVGSSPVFALIRDGEWEILFSILVREVPGVITREIGMCGFEARVWRCQCLGWVTMPTGLHSVWHLRHLRFLNDVAVTCRKFVLTQIRILEIKYENHVRNCNAGRPVTNIECIAGQNTTA